MLELKVMIIEDSEDDATVIMLELEKGGFSIKGRRIETALQMELALQEEKWDLILADYTVPGFGAIPALALLKSKGLDIPFIIVTGSIDDETAVAAMKAGASDYIMKDKLRRLAPAIERELREAATRYERVQAETEMELAATKLETVVEMLPDIFFVKDLNGRYQMVNSAFEKFVGLLRTEIINQTDYLLVEPSLAAEVQQTDRNTIESGLLRREERFICKNGASSYFDTIKVPLLSKSGEVVGIVGLSRDITEKKKIELELEKRLTQLQFAWEQTIKVLSDAVEAKDVYTSGHQKRVAALSGAIGEKLAMSGDALMGLKMASFIHDIGKLKIPGEILSKSGKLSTAEFELIKTHAEAGYEILRNAELPWNIAEIIYQHHERIDGSGYPRKLVDGEILLEAKIIAVADVVEAMSGHRPYRAALGIDKALDEIRQGKGKRYDHDVVAACLKLFEEKSFSFPTDESNS
ncbi:HD domain-containing phosphohydrolase [Azotosporobacter soli]|uniref:HD domain-containing phosphohydrolase n=1 Tax=Azotosporobacter soli TaxID=3055040 RepID=UPI0031FE7227